MFAIMNKWCGGWKRRRALSGKVYCLQFQLVLIVISVVLINLTFGQKEKSGNGTVESSEYYYYVDDDSVNGTSKLSSGLKNISSRVGSDEYYYYVEEVIIRPKNGTGGRLVSSKVIRKNGAGARIGGRLKNKGDSSKSESVSVYGLEDVHPSAEPLKEFVTQFDLLGPTYTDKNYGVYEVPGNTLEDVAIGEPLGPPFGEDLGDLPPNPFNGGQGDTDLLRPPPPPPTEPPEGMGSGSGIEFSSVANDIVFIDGNEHEEGGAAYSDGGGDDGQHNQQHLLPHLNLDQIGPNKLKINTELTQNAFGWAPSKNPIVEAKESLFHFVEAVLGMSKTDVILWIEKLVNVLAELAIPKEHYLRVISFVGVYLFISVLAYGSEHLDKIQCTVESKDKPLKQWKYHVGRRFVPARSVDPHMQEKFLDLFRGIDDDEDNSDEFSDLGKSLSSSEEDVADELDHISELCPKEAFYYSLNPRHIEAYTSLKHLFLAQGSAAEVLKLAKYLLVKEKVHPKVWYFAIIGASLGRTDMTGFSVAHPLDAIPDWYIPADLITDKMLKYRRGRKGQIESPARVKRYTVTHSDSRNTTIIRNKPNKYYHIKKKIKNGPKKEEEKDKPKDTNGKSPTAVVAAEVKVGAINGAASVTTVGNYTVTIVNPPKNITVSNKNSSKATASTKETLPVPTPTPIAPVVVNTSTVKTEATTTRYTVNKIVYVPPSSRNKTKTTNVPAVALATTVNSKQNAKPGLTPKPQPSQDVAGGGHKGDKGVLPSSGIKQGNKRNKRPGPHNRPGPNSEFDDDRNHDHHHHKHKKKKGKKKGKKEKKCITVDWRVGIDNGIENELWYFREDIMVNQHHWYWHQTHPVNSTMHGERRGENFVFFHKNIVARYNAERLSNGLPLVQPLQFRPGGIIREGYNSHIADINSGVYWTPRWPETPLSDVFHEHDPDFAQNITLRGYLRTYGSLVKAIKTGRLFTKYGDFAPIDHLRGIEPLANTVEASDLSVNPQYYNPMGIHALGHILVGLAADPDYRFRKVTGVMSDAALSMRDPAFYTYHHFLDNFFELHKRQLAPYRPIGGDFPLLWKGVELVKIELISQGGGPKNELRTFWTHHKFELSPGVDRSIEKGEHTKICAQHLDHQPFHFNIVIDRKPCVKSKSGKATIRIFMAPRYDHKGTRLAVKVQRRLMFALDSFPVKLKVGRNTITRYAEDSSLTQPWTKSLRDMERGPDPSGSADFCGCGWPQHLYIPKGHHAGMAFDLFVMVTNYDEDYVPNDPKILEIPETCNSPFIFCGLPRRRYPDKRPMGYPFDRPLFKSLNCPPGWTFFSVVCKALSAALYKPFDTLEQYVSQVPNMAMLKFHIKHLDIFLPEPPRH